MRKPIIAFWKNVSGLNQWRDSVENGEPIEKELELNEREAIILTRERMLENHIREILKREHLVAAKEERIEALLRQLQSLGLHEMAADLEVKFQSALADLDGDKAAEDEEMSPEDAESMTDGGLLSTGLWGRSVELKGDGKTHIFDALDEPDLDPKVRSNRFLTFLKGELEKCKKGEAWDRADRLRYLAETFAEAGNHDKATEYARRALNILSHFT